MGMCGLASFCLLCIDVYFNGPCIHDLFFLWWSEERASQVLLRDPQSGVFPLILISKGNARARGCNVACVYLVLLIYCNVKSFESSGVRRLNFRVPLSLRSQNAELCW